ncbi:MAG: YgjP-like metallopeptidase domain-containing protein [Lentisphaeria bacterium]|jgi:hypothetical protein
MDTVGYQVRESRRARRIRLEMTPAGLVVVVPCGTSAAAVAELVGRHREWIAGAARRVAERQAALGVGAGAAAAVPDRLELRAVGESWRLELRPERMPAGRCHLFAEGVRSPQPVLALAHAAAAPPPVTAVRALVREWLRRRAAAALPEWLRRTARETALPEPARIRLGFQRSRWGSCARDGGISLNVKLLFLPPELVSHIFVHELCHQLHMDHGAGFHRLLRRLDPAAARRRLELRRAAALVPAWCEV